MRIPTAKRLSASVFSLGAGGALALGIAAPICPANAQLTVFDPSNYAQNILTAARTLQQVNQQIQQLQNEAQMLVNQGKNLSRIDFPQLDAIKSKLAAIDALMGRATNIDFKVDQLDQKFAKLYPQDFSSSLTTDARVRDARTRLETSMAAFRQTMTVQAGVAENIHDDAEVLGQIVEKSQGAQGALQAQQATNQLLALAAKQQLQTQQLLAAQFRSDATEQARKATQASEARAATKKFLGSGSAYTPQ
ncbi:P-type conjugative transfer protein TrbJ [Novosphingobium sp. P6W]|uniref:P-type conjugative transfer protein TrbJ n=1 Tax=Novosphingobium sp. P6W TaxID=1609758 RepID=UPI0005C2D727|nr:P-type conjugative transfer protein TrbJ [Novosphingobium sp. P6W]AXB75869.1 P-type conjugative transfer protein TrbJ [Novosphingobium sp. P6W]KIS32929.1 conjugal transfer protein TrbJ [Novosphingobium sp. P6W]